MARGDSLTLTLARLISIPEPRSSVSLFLSPAHLVTGAHRVRGALRVNGSGFARGGRRRRAEGHATQSHHDPPAELRRQPCHRP